LGFELQNKIVCGDALSLIRTLPDRSVNLCLTSPPYAMQRRRQYGGIAEKEYPAWMCRWMSALGPKLTEDASVLIVIRSHVRHGVVSDYVLRTRLALREDGWCECEELVWVKPDAPPLGSKLRLRRTWENVLWFSRTAKPFIDLRANGRFSDRIGFVGSQRIRQENPIATKRPSDRQARTADTFTANWSERETGVFHPAMFPASLCERLIRTFSRDGDVVLDPFCGSGTALLAAKQTGRRYVGIETKKEYVQIAANRLMTTYTEHNATLDAGEPVRLRTDFPDSHKEWLIYFGSRGLNRSDAAVFEFILSKTVNSDEPKPAAELSHNQIATATKLSRRTVIRSISRLQDADLIDTEKDNQWHRGRPNRVSIAAPLLVPLEIRPSVTTAARMRRGGTSLRIAR
jgi:site-specific DNA-methyltransferase (adenine-specific)